MGCLAATTTVCIMIPMDTIKTRLVTQASMKAMAGVIPYKGIIDCAMRMAKEEGMATFYRGLPPRLVSVVPMIGIQFGVYEFMRQVMVERSITIAAAETAAAHSKTDDVYPSSLQQATMEVAASFAQPFPVPRFWTKISALTRNGGAVIRRKLQ
jgi:Mitochondrial carrier protein